MTQGRCIERITGADQEVASFITGTNTVGGTGYEASRRILAEVDGIPSSPMPSYSSAWGAASGYPSYGGASATPIGYYSQDHGRKYLLTNGGCIYIDLNHPEICIPEVTSAHDHVASTHAMLRVLRVAVERANRTLPHGQELEVLVNNSDGLSHSYGSHLNVLVSRATWDAIFSHKLHYLLFLASHQVSSIIYTGLGKIGAENERPWVDYQISQRADFFETLHGEQTTHRRPLVNSRDEALCGETLPQHTSGNGHSDDDTRRSGDGLARLHCIFYDANLAHVAMLLKVGVLQIIVTMIEAGVVDSRLILEDPLSAVHAWSRDLSFQTRCNRIAGRSVTAIDLQRRFLEAAERFASGGGLDGIVPRSSEILALWADTLDKLAARDMDTLARRLDWVLKLQTLERARRDHGFEWQSRELRYLDRLYSSLDETRGLYWNYERQGLIDLVVGDDRIEQLRREPPEDTRAWGRTMLLRSSEAGAEISRVDWDSVTLDLPDRARDGRGGRRVTVSLNDPRRWGKSDLAAVFDDGTPFGAMLGASEAIGDSSEPDAPAINGSSRGA